jgi:hypothetical protein
MKTVPFKTELLPIISQTGFTNRLALPARHGGEVTWPAAREIAK